VSGSDPPTIELTGSGSAPWQYAAHDVRPHFHPVTTPAGHVLTCNAPADHPWHHGLWFTVKFVDGDNFWEQIEPFGVLAHRGDPVVDGDGLRGEIDWVRPGGADVALHEAVSFRVEDLGDDDSTAVDVDITLSADRDVVLDRTPFTTWGGYGGLAFRGRPDLVDSTIALADGGHDRVLGAPSPWFDLSGFLGDDRVPVGVTVLDGATPGAGDVPWYGSCRSAVYGDAGWSNFFNAAFLWDGPMTLAAGQPMQFAYRVIAHDGVGDPGRIADQADAYVASRAAG
jgi:hypothetical protein